MFDATNAGPSPLGPVRPSFELTSLRVLSSLIDISLEIQNGILNVWFGANGSGKSLMLRAVSAVLRGDYSEFGDDSDLLFMATFAVPQNVEVWKEIQDRVDMDDWSSGAVEVVEEHTLTVDEILKGLEDSLLNPSSGVASLRLGLTVQSGINDSYSEFWTLEIGKDFGDGSGATTLELQGDFRNGLQWMFPKPVSIDNNLIDALPNWLPRILEPSGDTDSLFPTPPSFDDTRGNPIDASVFFETTSGSPEAARTEVEWNVRVKEGYQELMERLIESSQRFLPTFISETWILSYQFSPPSFGNEIMQIKLRSRTGDSNDMIDLTNASEGTRRWVTISLAIASIDLWARLSQEAEQSFVDSFDLSQRIEVSHYYFLLDEPEAHLSPNAITSVASSISTHLSPMTALIATHSPILIDGLKESATFRGIRGTKRTREIHTFHLSDFVDLRAFEDEMGLRASELLLRSGRLLLVEGDHDTIVLKHWFGLELDDSGVYVVKTSGTHNLHAILKLPLIKDVSKRVAVLLDRSKYQLPKGLEDIEVQVFRLDQPDILHYIPAAAVQMVSPTFPTWDETWSQYLSNDTWRKYMSPRDKGKTSRGWKKYIDHIYGLNLSFDCYRDSDAEWQKDLNAILRTTFFESLSQSPEETERLDELGQKVDTILNWLKEPPQRNRSNP